MTNPIVAWRRKRQQKQQLRELERIALCFGTLDKMEKSGLLLWKQKDRQLFILSQLAEVMMRSAETWQAFMNNVFSWLYHRECEAAWERHFMNEELRAVREAKKKTDRVLTLSEVTAIRQARREEILVSDMKQPEVKPFEFFISHPVRDNDGTWQQELLAVGVYDEGALELIPFEQLNI